MMPPLHSIGFLTTILAGCVSADPPARGGVPNPIALAEAQGVAAADLDGDGYDEPILVDAGIATWQGRSFELGGDLHAFARADLDGDGKEEIYLGTGMSRQMSAAPARVWRLRESGGDLLWERSGPRNQITDLRISEGKIWLAAYVDQKMVGGGWLTDGDHRVLVREHMAGAQVPISEGRTFVGRIYGERPKSDGDLRLLGGSAPRTLDTLRGVRTLALADLNDDGEDELLVSDGWHYAYAKQAQARVRLFNGPNWEESRTLATFENDYTIRAIHPMDEQLLVVGTSELSHLKQDDLGWTARTVSAIDESTQAVPVKTPMGWAALVSGSPAQLLPIP